MKNKVVRVCPYILFFLLMAVIIAGTIGYSGVSSADAPSSVKTIAEAEISYKETEKTVKLPAQVSGLEAGTDVNLTYTISPSVDDVLYIKTVYAPLKIYANGILIFQCGNSGTYPRFFLDPPTEVYMLSLPQSSGSITVRMAYSSPNCRSTLTLAAPLIGSNTAIRKYLLQQYGLSFLLSVLQMFIGCMLIFISLLFLPPEGKEKAILWLGVFAFASGIWSFAENNLTIFLLGNPSLFYILSFTGLFSIPFPFILFVRNMMDIADRTSLKILMHINWISLVLAIVLQLSHLIAFSQSMYWFHFLIPFNFIFLSIVTGKVAKKNNNSAAKWFFLPILMMAVTSLLETANYYFRLFNQISVIYQIGIMFFIIFSEVLGGYFIRESIKLNDKNRQLSLDLRLLEKQIDMRKERDALMLKNENSLREYRHDMRHHMAVLRQFGKEKDVEGLCGYIDRWIADFPCGSTKNWCENTAVNAMIAYYDAAAHSKGILTEIKMTVPRNTEHIRDSGLCIIIGNLMENAIEACERMKEGERFIRLASVVQGEMLSIAMDNSFDGNSKKQGECFRSSKRNEIGTGLLSIRSTVAECGGAARFEPVGKIFRSSILVRL